MSSWNERLTMSTVLVLGAVACGGATNGTTVTSSEAGADGTSGSSSGASSGGDANEPGGDDAGDDASQLIMGGSSSGGTGDAMASSSGAARSDGGPDQIACGAAGSCDSTIDVCCATKTGRQCVAIGSCTGDSLACSGSNSCTAGSGDVCCEELTMTGLVRTRCATACPAGSPQLCTTKAECKPNEDCVHRLDGYGACVAIKDAGAGAADAAEE